MRRFKEGERVVFDPDLCDRMRAGLPRAGTQGTVSLVATIGGPSVYPDPMKSMVFVSWDSGEQVGVGRSSVRPI